MISTPHIFLILYLAQGVPQKHGLQPVITIEILYCFFDLAQGVPQKHGLQLFPEGV